MKYVALLFILCCFALLIGCQINNDQKSYDDAVTDSTSATGLTGDSVKLVKTAAITFKVKNAEETIRSVAALVKQFSGSITYQNLNAEEEKRNELKLSKDSLLVIAVAAPRADLTVRVPSQNLEDFIFSVADLGYYTGSSRLQVDDKSLLYLENALKQKNRSLTSSKAALRTHKPLSVLETVAMQDEAIGQRIANKAIDGDVRYSTVNISVLQNSIVRKEIVANTNIADYNLPLWLQSRNAILGGWTYFVEFLVAILHLWMFVVVGGASYFWYKHWLQKRKLALSTQKAE